MVEIAGKSEILEKLKAKVLRSGCLVAGAVIVMAVLYGACTARVAPNEFGVEQSKLGGGIVETPYGPGLYFVGPGTTMHTFPREIHVLEASAERDESRAKARSADGASRVDEYYEQRD
ncbi:MAG TPA: hypothetical protein VGR00_07850, partial [Thermoanaerobaculia bacterium]|nr:hypothetical protein [Thermoanaerobaculia bacterium]